MIKKSAILIISMLMMVSYSTKASDVPDPNLIVEYPLEDKLVSNLYHGNFYIKLWEFNVAVVFFYVPTVQNLKLLEEELEKAAKIVKNLDYGILEHWTVTLAKVDCSVEVKLCEEYKATEYPSMKIYKRGEFKRDYTGPIDHDNISSFLFTYITSFSYDRRFHYEDEL
jgi:hypothetical protein